MPTQKRLSVLYSIAAGFFGFILISGLIEHNYSYHTWLRLIAFVCFTISAILAYRKHQEAKPAA